MSFALNVQVELETEECCVCGLTFAMPASFKASARKDHSKTFYCPAGHIQHYTGETEAQKYKRLFEEKERALASEKETKDRQYRLLIATNKKLTNLKKRAAAGVCPCCKRTVSQMARHMATKHPDFEKQEIGP